MMQNAWTLTPAPLPRAGEGRFVCEMAASHFTRGSK
jgi:hypothetical protein